ncbi:MAG: hypothetical protein QXI27_01645 [Nitrososphaerota archaeon]
MSPRSLMILIIILVTFVSAFSIFTWGLLTGIRAVLGIFLRLGLLIFIILLLLGLVVFRMQRTGK